MKEVWKDIKGYEGFYQVSNLGRVRSFYRMSGKANIFHKGRVVKPILGSVGYFVVSLYKHGACKQMHVHRLVAEAFCEKPNGCNIVDHINTDVKDNRASNLRWTTIKGNVNNPLSVERRLSTLRGMLCGRFGAKHPKSKAVLQLNMDGTLVRKWLCASDAVRECGFDSGSITRCCKGINSHHKGYRWEYAV